MSKVTPFLWFDTEAEEAARFYVSLIEGSEVTAVTHYVDDFPDPSRAGTVMTVEFRLGGRPFVALNGGPQFPFTEAISLSVDCADQAEVDRMWAALTEDGEEGQCGWCKDRYGLSWQIVPAVLRRLLSGGDPAGVSRAVAAMLRMGKIDVAALERAYAAG